MGTITRILLAGGAGLAVLASAGLALAGTAPAPAPAPGNHHRHHGLTAQQKHELRRTGHVTFTRTTTRKGPVTVEVQRGAVTALSPSSITLRSRDGYTHNYVIDATTTVREKGRAVPLTELTPGERVMVTATSTPSGDVAHRISCLKPALARKGAAAPAA